MLWAVCIPAAQPTTRKKERKKQASYKGFTVFIVNAKKIRLKNMTTTFAKRGIFKLTHIAHSISFDEETNKLTVV